MGGISSTQRVKPERLHPDVFADLQARIAIIEHDLSLAGDAAFVAREAARAEIEQQIVRLEQLMAGAPKGEKQRLRALKRQALAVQRRLEYDNEQLFVSLRAQVQAGDYDKAALRLTLERCVDPNLPEEWDDPPRYDALDTLVDGILQIGTLPRAQRQPEPDMVGYQPTPARIVLDLVRRLALGPADVLYDLGCGLGRVVLLAALASDARVTGVEFEPTYVAFAQRRAADLNLARASFINADAREVNYADGTVFFLYTPFKGKILQRVLALLRYEAGRRRIRVCGYGPGTLDLLEQDWLAAVDEPDIHRAEIFVSR